MSRALRITAAFWKWMRRRYPHMVVTTTGVTHETAFRAGIRYEQTHRRAARRVVDQAHARHMTKVIVREQMFAKLIEELSSLSPAHRRIADKYREYLPHD